jgi:manganese oxidase
MRLIASLVVGSAVALLNSATGNNVAARAYLDHRVLQAAASTIAPNAVANDNRVPAGTHVGDTLYVRLTITPADWHILSDSAPAFREAAFQEEGKAPSIPAPLIRARSGTPIHVVIRNPLDDTLVVRGLSERGGANDSLVVLPRSTADARFVRRLPGTYQYWGTLAQWQRALPLAPNLRGQGLLRPRFDAPLAGALVIDAPGPIPKDRIFVIGETDDQAPPLKKDRRGPVGRQFTVVNGKSWPYTERLHYALGDTIRWRIVNTTFQAHPMHLHGFYFRVDSHGSARTGVDSIYTAAQRRMAVTEVIGIGESATLVWSPDRAGGWLFHCHLTNHIAMLPPVDQPGEIDYPAAHDHGDPDHHAVNGMNGLVLGITVTGRMKAAARWRPAKRLRLFVQSDSVAADSSRRFGYALQRGTEPRRDSIESPAPLLLLTRGEPTTIEVVNHSTEPTTVHWHGIEVDDSYYDGAAGWSGDATRKAPAIRPGTSFDVHITPRRAGTFIYHTHFNEMRQQFGGLAGPLIVLEPGERWDPSHELLFFISDASHGSVVINGTASPAPMDLRAGSSYRLRVANIASDRGTLLVRVVQDSTVTSWRPIAKDGFALPANQATTRPSIARVGTGETADFQFTPTTAGDLRLEIGGAKPTGGIQVEGAVRLRVSPSAK